MEQQDPQLTVEQAIANLQGDDLGKRVYAAWWLGRFRVNDPEAIEVLITALQDEDDRTDVGGYPLRRTIISDGDEDFLLVMGGDFKFYCLQLKILVGTAKI